MSVSPFPRASAPDAVRVALLTGGMDKPYALGLLDELVRRGVAVDFVGNDEMRPEAEAHGPCVRYLNLRGDQNPAASFGAKAVRVLRYYGRLMRFAATTRCPLLHVLWNNKFEHFDRTILLFYYRLLGKRLVFTAHNVNAGVRDGTDSAWNRWTLRRQYRNVHHLFVHTDRMKTELVDDFGVLADRVSVIPFGINNTLPQTDLTPDQARAQLGLEASDKVLLFFGNVAPYKGLEDLVAAMTILRRDAAFKLLIAGQLKKGAEAYWAQIDSFRREQSLERCVLPRIGYVPDDEVERYFKAADVFVLPYRHIFQSGVLFLGYNFGLPAIVTDVGALRDDVVEGHTGFVCRPKSPEALAETVREYFSSDLYRNLAETRPSIRAYAAEKYSWSKAGDRIAQVYRSLSQASPLEGAIASAKNDR